MAAILPPALAPAEPARLAETPRAGIGNTASPDWRARALALSARAAAARDRASAAGLWAQAAAEHAANGSGEAEALARRALAFVPGHVEGSLVLAELLLLRGERSEARALLGEAWREHPGDERVGDALEPICEEARDWTTLDAILVARLEGASGPGRRALFVRLARVRAARGDHAGQVSALEQLAGDAGALDADERGRAWLGAAALRQGRLGDVAGAYRCAAEAVRLHPEDADTREACDAFARAAGAEGALLALLEEILPRLRSAPERECPVRLRAAALAERDPARREAAAGHYARVLELAPSNPVALAGLTRLALAACRWSEACDLIRARADAAAAAPERSALLEKLTELLASRLHDPRAAAAACRAAADAAPPEHRVRLLERLASLAEAAGDARQRLAALLALPPGLRDPRAVLATLEQLARAEGDRAERARLELRIAAIAELDLGQTSFALAAIARAVRACPELEDARRELARVAAALGLEGERARVLADVASTATGDAALAIWREVAEVRAATGDASGAAVAWEEVRRRAPGDGPALSALARIYDAASRRSELASVLAELRARGALDVAARGRLAELLAFELDLPRESLPVCAEVLEADPASRSGLRVAVALASRADALGRSALPLAERALASAAGADAADAWEAIARGSGDPEAWRRCARLREARGEADAARGAWRALRAQLPTDLEAARALDGLLTPNDPAAERAEVARVALAPEGPERLSRLPRYAALAADAGDAVGAADAWAEIARAAPSDRDAVAALEQLARGGDAVAASRACAALEAALRSTGDHRRLMRALEVRLGRAQEGAERGAVLEELATMHERLGEDDAAARRSTEAARCAPSASSWRAVARAERRRGAWRELATAMTEVAQHATGSRERTEAWCEVAKVMDAKLGDRDGALAAWRRALAEDPEDAAALGEVARLLGAAERWAELADVLARQAALAERRPERAAEGAELRLEAARIRQERMGDAAGALRIYRDVLDRVPAHPDAVEALHALACAGSVEAALAVEPVHERAGDAVRRAEVLEARAAATEDGRARAALRLEIARLREGAGDVAGGFDAAALALRDDPDAVAALAVAERLSTGRDDAFAELLASCARRGERPEARAAIQRRIARRSADPRAAAAAWTTVLEVCPGDPEAIEGLVSSQRRAENAAGLADALRLRVDALPDARGRAACLAELAAVEERRGDLAAAAAALRAWLDVEPDQRDALARLDRVLDAGDRAEELGEVLARELALADRAGDSGAAVALRFRLAELRMERRGDRDGALALLEEVLERDAGHDGALARLEALLEATPSDERIARALLDAHARGQRWDAFAAALEIHAPELPSAAERKGLLAKLAEVRERKLGNAELAFVALARAFQEDPADATVRAELTRLAAATDQDEELAAALEESLERVSGATAAELLVSLGTLCADRLGEPERAVDWWVRAWRLDSERAAPVLPRLERLCADVGRHAELADLLEWRAGRQQGGAARAELLDRAARLASEKLAAPDRAIALWREAVAAQPGHLAALRALAQAGEERGRAAELLAFGDALASAGLHAEAGDVARRTLALERLSFDELDHLAALCTSVGARAERARASERRAAARPQGGSAPWREAAEDWSEIGHWDAAAAALEKALADDGDEATFARLREVHRRRGAWADDARLCLEHAERVPEDSRRAELLAEAARVQEQRLGQRDLAFFSWCRVLALAPGDAEAAGAAERLAGEGGAWEDLAAVWEQVADAASGAGRAAALVSLARIRERLGDADGHRSALSEALRAEPASEEALSLLTASLAREERWAHVVAALELARDAAPPERGAGLQRRIAEITEARLDDPDAALDAWREANRRDPDDGQALDAVERLCTELARWEELDGVFVERARRTAAPREKAAWLRRSAALRDERLDDVAGALRRAEDALALDPADAATLARLARLYERAGRVADRARILERQAAVTTDVRERLALFLGAGEAWTVLGDRSKAEAAWREALRLDPENPDSLAAVADLHEKARESSAALEALRRLAASPRAARRAADAWFRIGRIEHARGDAVAAEEAWRRALDLDGGHVDAIRALRGAREAAGDRAAVMQLLAAEAGSAADPKERARALTELGTLARRDRQDVEWARRCYSEALEADPDRLDAAKPLAEIHVARGEWDRAAPLLERIVEHLSEADRREAARWWHRLGLAAEQLGDRVRALACQRRARDLDGTSLPVLERLVALAEPAGALEDALAAQEAVLAHHRDGLTREERAAAHARVAALEQQLGRSLRAIAALNEALTVDADVPGARERLVQLLEARGEHRAAVNHRRKLAEALPREARAGALAEIAAVCRDRLDDLPSAVEALEAAVRLAPADVSLADALVSAYLRAGQPERAADALARLVAHPAFRAEPSRAARVALALGRLRRDRARDGAGAARAFEDALALDPTLGEALAEVEALLAADRRWRDLERVYRGVLERIPRTLATRGMRAILWRALEGLYANALDDPEAARTAAGVAASIEAGAPAPARG